MTLAPRTPSADPDPDLDNDLDHDLDLDILKLAPFQLQQRRSSNSARKL